MSDSKNHHYLPQCYLKGFRSDADDKEAKILTVPKHSRPFRHYSSPIKNTGCERDYNTIELRDTDKDRTTIEQNLSKVETKHSDLIRKIILQKEVKEEDKLEVIKFLALMRTRVPENKKSIESLLKNAVQSTHDILEKQGKLPPMPDALKEMIEKHGKDIIKIEIANWKLLEMMYEQAQDEKIIEMHSRLNITLCEITNDHFFITSDTPVSIYYPNHKGPYGAGILMKDTELFLPITQKFGLLFTNKQVNQYKVLDSNEIKEYNRRTIIMAKSYIYLQKITDDLTKLIKIHWNKSAGNRVERINFGDGSYIIGRTLPVTD